MALEFGQHRKRASPDLFIYIYSSTHIHAYICCLHGISCSDPHLEHHWFEHSSLALSLSLKYLPIKWLFKQQNPKFAKIILFWLMVLEFDKHHKRASPDLSTYIYSSISISTYIYICVYLLFAWNQLQ